MADTNKDLTFGQAGKKVKIGRYIIGEGGSKAFALFTFPPKDGFFISLKLYKKHEEAIRLIGELDGITRLLPDKSFFVKMFVKKEATYSSLIEGRQTTLDDIERYIKAINYALGKTSYLPFSLTLLREIHEKLLTGANTSKESYPGKFRKSQNWIGGKTLSDAIFIPPVVDEMSFPLNDLEKFAYVQDDYPALIKTALLHAQFEAIHPFTDGNGRVGRILITLYIHNKKLLDAPVLYLSSYFLKNKKMYYQRLNEYHNEDATVDSWLDFFLDGVIETANASINTCVKINDLHSRDFAKLQKIKDNSASIFSDLIRKLYGQPIIGVAEVKSWTGYTLQKSHDVIEQLEKLAILEPLGKAGNGQQYVYADYYQLFDETYRESRIKTKKAKTI